MNKYTKPDYENAALLTIDMQIDFLHPDGEDRYDRKRAVNAAARLARLFRQTGRPVVHIVRLYMEDGSNADLCRREELELGKLRTVLPGSEGAKVVESILEQDCDLDTDTLLRGKLQQIGDNEYIIYKPRFGAFYDTPLDELLTVKGVNTIVFTGFNFPNCPRSSIYEASERDYRIVFTEDGISNMYSRGMAELEAIGAVKFSSGALMEEIRRWDEN